MALLSQKHIALIGALAGGWYISPSGYNLYQLRSDDTLQSLAASYLGDANRWQEIWVAQSSGYQNSHDPNNLPVGDQLFMPQEAIDNAKASGDASGGKGEAPSKASSGKTLDNGTDVLVTPSSPSRPSTPSAPAKPSPLVSPPAPSPSSSGGMSLAAKIAIGAVSVAAAGGAVAYGVHHFKKHARRSNPRRARRRNGNVRGVDVERVRLNQGGYDSRGRYWGIGQPLYAIYNEATGRNSHVRAASAKEARAKAGLR